MNLEDSVLTVNNQCGTVRFIGHLDGFAPTCLFVGLQLPEKGETKQRDGITMPFHY